MKIMCIGYSQSNILISIGQQRIDKVERFTFWPVWSRVKEMPNTTSANQRRSIPPHLESSAKWTWLPNDGSNLLDICSVSHKPEFQKRRWCGRLDKTRIGCQNRSLAVQKRLGVFIKDLDTGNIIGQSRSRRAYAGGRLLPNWGTKSKSTRPSNHNTTPFLLVMFTFLLNL